MPFGNKVECSKCKETNSVLWHTIDDGKIQCNSCFDHALALKLSTEEETNRNNAVTERVKLSLRKSTRITRIYKTRSNPNPVQKTTSHKGRGRRFLLKKVPVKAPTATSTIITSNCTFHKGSYIQTGDIVSVRDVEGGIYFAQIRGLMTDQYCEKSAVITWLVPTKDYIAGQSFDPKLFTYGPQEEIPRKLEYLEFVMHAPINYFKPYNPFCHQTNPVRSEAGFIWGSLTTGSVKF